MFKKMPNITVLDHFCLSLGELASSQPIKLPRHTPRSILYRIIMAFKVAGSALSLRNAEVVLEDLINYVRCFLDIYKPKSDYSIDSKHHNYVLKKELANKLTLIIKNKNLLLLPLS